jgi:predicted site-specific integrase-resolvase
MDAAKTLGVSTATLKRFLLKGDYLSLLKRTPGGHYRFTEEDVHRIDFLMTEEGIHRHPEQVMFRRRRTGGGRW